MSRKNDSAVSPVIGTILLVAMTVIFVALVAVVVMGLSSGMFDSKQVGLTLTPYGINSEGERGIFVTIFGGADAGDLVSLSASLNGPELVYRETNNSSVVNPAVGPDYRFKAVESNTHVTTIRGKVNKIEVDLNTTEILPVAATEYVVTVTGKFRDGTEQVLLIQKVTLPAIPKSGSVSDAAGYVSVSTYSISDNYPGHGFIIHVLDPDKYELRRDLVEFTVTSRQPTVLLTDSNGGMARRNFDEGDLTRVSFDINTATNGSPSTWENTPYPDLETCWPLGKLTGNVTVTVKDKDTQNSNPKIVTVSGIVIPPRVNIFENTSKYAGTIRLSENKIQYISSNGDSSPICYYFISSGAPVILSDTNNARSVLEKHRGEILEAYVKEEKVGDTMTKVWYRVASVPVSTLLNT